MSSSPVYPIFIATDHAAAFAPLINPERCERSSNVTNRYLIRQLIVHFSLIGGGGIPAFAQVRSAPAGPHPPDAQLRRRPVVTRQRLCDLAVTYPDRSGRLDDPDERCSPRRPSGPSSPPNGEPGRPAGPPLPRTRPSTWPVADRWPDPHFRISGRAPVAPRTRATRPSLQHVHPLPWGRCALDGKRRAPTSRRLPRSTGRCGADKSSPLCGLSRCPRRPSPQHAAHRAAQARRRDSGHCARRQGRLSGSDEAARPTRSSGAPPERIARPARTRCHRTPGHGPRPTPGASPRAAGRPAPHRARGGPERPAPPVGYLLARTGPGTPGLTGAEACLPRSR
ncbi:hypothetical protein GA0074696_4650 [Micromonospora purpureochromogenes]|uniref:Uncharacterized protein n=1 Tax=Micromonospora purpureochromogenes TaxID=47872 RepID=A0A1C4ZNC7_9ACTN|nr:hypothetical protein GA0074696_4650 [Micromonospora purpureochromogenes]